MKETLKRLKALLMLDLTGSATIEIMPVDLAKAVGIEIPVEKLPFIAVAPKNTDREVETTLQIRPNHEIQITILAVYPNMEEAIIGGGNNKGIVQQVQDVIDVIEFNTLDGYLVKGAIVITEIAYETLPREPDYFQIAILTAEIEGNLEKKA